LQSENIFDYAIWNFTKGDTELDCITSGNYRDNITQIYEVPPQWAIGGSKVHPSFPPISDVLINKVRTPTVLTLPKEKPVPPYFKNEPIDLHYVNTCSSVDLRQPQIEFMDKIIETIICSKVQPQMRDLEQLSGLIGVTEGALMFVHRVVQYTNTKNPDCCISDAAFGILSDAFTRVLMLSNEQQDFRAPAELTKLANVYYHRVGRLPEFLYARLSACEIWKNTNFWESTFFNDLQRRRADLPLHFRTTLDDWDTFSADQQAAVVQQEEDLLFKAIASLVLSMNILAGPNQARHFISGMSSFALLSNKTIVQLNSFHQNTSNANTQESTLLESLKPRDHKHQQDSTHKIFDIPAQKEHLRVEYERVLQAMNASGRTSQADPVPKVDKGYSTSAGGYCTTLQGYIGAIECTAYMNNLLVCGSSMGHVATWDVDACLRVSKMTGHKDKVTKVLFNGPDIVSSSLDKTLRIWDTEKAKEKLTLQGHAGQVLCCDATTSFIVSGSSDHGVRLWDPRMGTSIAELKGHTESVVCVQLGHRDSATVVVSGSQDKTLRVWDVRKVNSIHTLNAHTDWIRCILLEGHALFSGSFDTTVKQWDIKNGKCKRTYEGHQGCVNCMSFDPGTNRLFTGSGDRTLRMWNTQSGQPLSIYQGHTDEVTALATLDDWIVTASFDQTVRIWDHSKTTCNRILSGHTDWIGSLHAVSKKRIISGSWDYTIKVWNLE